jgi:hypothetical protein
LLLAPCCCSCPLPVGSRWLSSPDLAPWTHRIVSVCIPSTADPTRPHETKTSRHGARNSRSNDAQTQHAVTQVLSSRGNIPTPNTKHQTPNSDSDSPLRGTSHYVSSLFQFHQQ